MKEIPNKRFNETDTVATVLTVCLNTVPPGGLDFATIRARNKVSDVLDAVKEGDTIKLEDADFATAKAAIGQTRWMSRGKHLVEFAELFGL